jgi:hypothetical protein
VDAAAVTIAMMDAVMAATVDTVIENYMIRKLKTSIIH